MSNKQPEPLVQLGELEREINHLCSQLEHERTARQRLERELQKSEDQVTHPDRLLVAIINKLDALRVMVENGTDPQDFLNNLIDDLTRMQASGGQQS